MTSDYDEINEVGRWVRRGIGWTVLAMVVLGIVGGILNAFGLIGGTILEREVYENSYQYTEARKSEIMTYEAQLAEIDARLSDSALDPQTRAQLEGTRSAIQVRLRVAQEKKDEALLQR